MLHATGAHDVTFQTRQGTVTAHSHMLIDASPVLKAMLESFTKGGTTQCIEVKDTTKNGVTLLLQMIYTCSSQDEPSYETFLEALDLAHRWQVSDAISIIAQALSGMLEPKSFPSIAEAAVLKGLEELKTACRSFARTSSAVQGELEKGKLPAAVQDLFGQAARCRSSAKA
ncbi:KLHL6 [Symbiodinium sp. CCMP2456]|nr:KLHL6 [Symbiodinium sp. CCMP2456]